MPKRRLAAGDLEHNAARVTRSEGPEQTRRFQTLVVVGSSPTLGTTDTSGWRNWQTRQVEILSVVGSSPIPGTEVSALIDFLKNGQLL